MIYLVGWILLNVGCGLPLLILILIKGWVDGKLNKSLETPLEK